MKGKGTAFGAISIVNAIAGGKGATASVRLTTEAEVEVKKEPGEWRVLINGKESNSRFAVEVVRATLRSLDKNPSDFSGTVETRSDIPIQAGLKSSSSSSVAVSLATLASIGFRSLDPRRVMNCSVEASLSAKVSITGALDDAASCLIGGLNHADNLKRMLVRSRLFDRAFKVVIRVPAERSKRPGMNLEYVRKFGNLADNAFKLSMAGDSWTAMTLNGVLYCSILNYDPSPALRAIELGALGAGLSGTGPAVAAILDAKSESSVKELAKDWGSDGSVVIVTETNNEHGRLVALD